MKYTLLNFILLLLLMACSDPVKQSENKYPKKDIMTAVYDYIKADTSYRGKIPSDFRVVAIESKNIDEGYMVNARILFKKREAQLNQITDTTLWINNIKMSSQHGIIKWGTIGKRVDLVPESKEGVIYRNRISLKEKQMH